VSGPLILLCVVALLNLFLSLFPKILGFHTFKSVLPVVVLLVCSEPALWNHLSEEKELQILVDVELPSENLDKPSCVD